jgi:hypothetical protein
MQNGLHLLNRDVPADGTRLPIEEAETSVRHRFWAALGQAIA